MLGVSGTDKRAFLIMTNNFGNSNILIILLFIGVVQWIRFGSSLDAVDVLMSPMYFSFQDLGVSSKYAFVIMSKFFST